jgi:hypothetical protein
MREEGKNFPLSYAERGFISNKSELNDHEMKGGRELGKEGKK